jgi:hypothetical protein
LKSPEDRATDHHRIALRRFLRCETFCAKTGKVLCNLGPVGHPTVDMTIEVKLSSKYADLFPSPSFLLVA